MLTNDQSQEFKKAKTIAFRLLKIRQRSQKELADRLKQKEISADMINRTLAFLKEYQFIDDIIFARLWIKSRLRKPFGANRIRMELMTKGIAKDIIKEQLEAALGESDEKAVIQELIEKRKKRLQALDPLKEKKEFLIF